MPPSKCLYPGCRKPVYRMFREIPLCEEHWYLCQFMAYAVIKSSEEGGPDIIERLEALETLHRTGD